MNHIRSIRRVASILGGLAASLLALAAGSPAAFAMPWPNPDRPAAPPEVQAVVTGGMPGWQITLIAAGAAVLAATAAVLFDRARAARRRTAVPTT